MSASARPDRQHVKGHSWSVLQKWEGRKEKEGSSDSTQSEETKITTDVLLANHFRIWRPTRRPSNATSWSNFWEMHILWGGPLLILAVSQQDLEPVYRYLLLEQTDHFFEGPVVRLHGSWIGLVRRCWLLFYSGISDRNSSCNLYYYDVLIHCCFINNSEFTGTCTSVIPHDLNLIINICTKKYKEQQQKKTYCW